MPVDALRRGMKQPAWCAISWLRASVPEPRSRAASRTPRIAPPSFDANPALNQCKKAEGTLESVVSQLRAQCISPQLAKVGSGTIVINRRSDLLLAGKIPLRTARASTQEQKSFSGSVRKPET
jgi:hypothetical protein